MKFRLLALIGSALALVAGVGCTGQNGGPSGSQPATVNVSILDAPFSLGGHTVTQVNVALKEVDLIGSGGHQVLATFSPDKVVNLLDFQTTPLNVAAAAIPAGVYQQFRLVLDTASSATNIVVDGATFPLVIPSATGPEGFGGNTSTDQDNGPGTAGIKVNAHFMAQGGFTYGFVIDFNAAESIVFANNEYMMKPVLVATAVATSGAIAGTVTNSINSGAVVNAQVLAEQGATAINSGVTDTSGHYQINALPAGTYTIVVNNTWTNQAGQAMTATNGNGAGPFTVNNVTVINGQVTTVNDLE